MPISVKHGTKKSIPLMKALWKEVFGDTDEFIDTFFTQFYRPSRTLLAFDGGELVSMLYCMDVKAKYFRKRLKCAYLYGVATKLSERRQGIFKKLHQQLIDELREKKYDAVLVIPASDTLFGLYKELGYTVSLKKFEYRLLTQDLTEIADPMIIWKAKSEQYKASRYGLRVLESAKQFSESRKDHKFFSYNGSFLSFAPTKNGYVLYEAVSPTGESLPVEQVHYERNALMLDLNGKLDAELIEKQKAELNYLLN